MHRFVTRLIVASALFLALLTGEVLGEADSNKPPSLIGEAEAVVAANVLRTDYTLTAADGPMYGEALVLKSVKGSIPKNRRVRFGVSAWVNPTYRAGEQRILFLKPVVGYDYYSKAEWVVVNPLAIDIFIGEESLEDLSINSLGQFIEVLEAARADEPKVVVVYKAGAIPSLDVTVTNESDRPLYFNLSMMHFMFEASNIRYTRSFHIGVTEKGSWTSIDSGKSFAGTIMLARKEIEGADQILVWLSHRSAIFPYRCWTGTVVAGPVPLAH
jgi:hypothetical protein